MASTAVEFLVAPALVAIATLAARRWGERAGGVMSAFPAIVGPVLLILALAHGAQFAARAANGTLLGLVSLGAFALAYGRVALRRGWRVALGAGWLCAAMAALTVGLAAAGAGSPAGLLIAAAALSLAWLALPPASLGRPRLPPRSPDRRPLPPASPGRPRLPPRSPDRRPLLARRAEIALRMGTASLLVALLAAAAGAVGAVAGGMLTALPVLACVLAVFTHREQGARAAVVLLRGMLAGMASFLIFCQLIATLITPLGIAPAFAAATVAAVAIQAAVVYAPLAVHSLLRRHSSAPSAAVATAAGSFTRQSS